MSKQRILKIVVPLLIAAVIVGISIGFAQKTA